ncbi:MAG: NAD(P)H-binding protein [Myxococcaceae bacterium]
MSMVLVAGASGVLGREVARLFQSRGHRVRALSRKKSLPGPFDEVFTADARDPKALAGAAKGCELVFSCLGASVMPEFGKGWSPYTSVDTPANLALISEAKQQAVKRFVYVSVYHLEQMRTLAYVRAHEDVVTALEASGLKSAVIRPTGFFSALQGLLPLAKKGALPVFGSGNTTSNPIDDRDLAQLCFEAAGSDEARLEVAAGGPEVLSRLQMNGLAFDAVGKPPKTMRAPVWAASLASVMLYPLNPRIAQFIAFLGALSRHDVVAPSRGTKKLGDALKAAVSAS